MSYRQRGARRIEGADPVRSGQLDGVQVLVGLLLLPILTAVNNRWNYFIEVNISGDFNSHFPEALDDGAGVRICSSPKLRRQNLAQRVHDAILHGRFDRLRPSEREHGAERVANFIATLRYQSL